MTKVGSSGAGGAGLYSQHKVAWHIDRIDALRSGRVPAPVHVQMIVSDLCNQDCLPAGTQIECPDGFRAIETLKIGDLVIGADGEPVPVREIGNRISDHVYEISCAGRLVRCTGEHPILTADGWKNAKDVSPADSAAVRVRLRKSSGASENRSRDKKVKESLEPLASRSFDEGAKPSVKGSPASRSSSERSGWKAVAMRMWLWRPAEVESTSKEVGRVHIRSCQDTSPDGLCNTDGDSSGASRRRFSSSVSLWMRQAGQRSWAWRRTLLGKLPYGALWPREAFQYVATGEVPYGASDAKAEPDVRSCNRAKGSSHSVRGRIAVEERTAILEVGKAERFANKFSWRRETLGESAQPRLQGSWAKEGVGNNDIRDLQWWRNCAENAGRLRRGISRALQEKWMALLGRVLSSGSQKTSTGCVNEGRERLCIAGIELGSGLELRRIDAVRLIKGDVRVYNFACPPIEAYIAGGMVVHNCGFCAYRISSGLSHELFGTAQTHNPNRKIPTAKAIEIIGDCAAVGVQAIQFTGGGEPTVHPDHLSLFSAAQALGMKTALVTNGVRLDASHDSVRAMTWIRVSIDAGTSDTYARVRRVSKHHWDKAWAAIGALAKHCAGTVGVGFVVTPDNYTEITAAARLAKEHGARNIRVGAVFSTEGRSFYGDLIQAILEEIDRAEELSCDGFEVVNLFGRRIGDLDGGSPTESLCGYQYLTTYIGGDLGVYRCCNTAYTRIGKVADLNHVRFRDLFGGAPQPFDARQCRFCQFRGQNEVMAALLRKPAHAEFV